VLDAHRSAHAGRAPAGLGWAEVDVKPNPLRDSWPGAAPVIVDGQAQLSDAPGIGEPPDWVPRD